MINEKVNIKLDIKISSANSLLATDNVDLRSMMKLRLLFLIPRSNYNPSLNCRVQ